MAGPVWTATTRCWSGFRAAVTAASALTKSACTDPERRFTSRGHSPPFGARLGRLGQPGPAPLYWVLCSAAVRCGSSGQVCASGTARSLKGFLMRRASAARCAGRSRGPGGDMRASLRRGCRRGGEQRRCLPGRARPRAVRLSRGRWRVPASGGHGLRLVGLRIATKMLFSASAWPRWSPRSAELLQCLACISSSTAG